MDNNKNRLKDKHQSNKSIRFENIENIEQFDSEEEDVNNNKFR